MLAYILFYVLCSLLLRRTARYLHGKETVI